MGQPIEEVKGGLEAQLQVVRNLQEGLRVQGLGSS